MICLETNTGKCLCKCAAAVAERPERTLLEKNEFCDQVAWMKREDKVIVDGETGLFVSFTAAAFLSCTHTGVSGSGCDARTKCSACLLQFLPLLLQDLLQFTSSPKALDCDANKQVTSS